MVAKCMSDFVNVPLYPELRLHKLNLGSAAVILDIISVLVIYYLFNKLKDINYEYQEIMDNNIIKMSKFTIRLNGLKLSKNTQDPRILKMKIWLHFQKLLEAHRTEDNQMEVADVQISNSK